MKKKKHRKRGMMAKRYTKDFKHSLVQLVIRGKMTLAWVRHKYHLAKSCLFSGHTGVGRITKHQFPSP